MDRTIQDLAMLSDEAYQDFLEQVVQRRKAHQAKDLGSSAPPVPLNVQKPPDVASRMASVNARGTGPPPPTARPAGSDDTEVSEPASSGSSDNDSQAGSDSAGSLWNCGDEEVSDEDASEDSWSGSYSDESSLSGSDTKDIPDGIDYDINSDNDYDPGVAEEDEPDMDLMRDNCTNDLAPDGSDSDVEYMPQLPSDEQLTYHHEPLDSSLTARIQQDLQQEVEYHGKHTLGDTVNLSVFGETGLARCIEQPGSWIVISPEQSGKTGGKAGLTLISTRLGHPTVVLIKDVKANALKVAHDLQALLKPFDITVMYMSGRKIWESVDVMSSMFIECKVVLVMSAYNTELECLNDFLEDHRIAGVTVIADESDNIWSSEICDPNATEHELRSRRETEMYHLLGSATDPSRRQTPLAKGSRVRSLIQVSATHIATIVWHCQWKLPFRFVTADKDMLDQRGYALARDLKLVGTLDPAEVKASNDYGMQSEQVVKELEVFAQDTRPGRLMVVCLSPYVEKQDAMTSFGIAHRIRESHVPDAVCIVVHGGGVNAIYNDHSAGSSSRPDPSCEKGVPIFVRSADASHRADQGGKRRRGRHQQDEQAKRSRQASDAIKKFDAEFGLVKPLIVIGYNMIGRCTSIRSRSRVITHIIGAYQQGRSKADAEQMLMRGNGQSREARARHGFDHVRMVTTEASWWIVQDLYRFTEEALQKSGTGRSEDLMKWYKGEYSEEFRKLFQDKRPWYRKTMGLLDTSGFRVQGTGRPFLLPAEMPEHGTQHGPRRETKRRRISKDTTGFRLMKSIWALAEEAEDHQFSKVELDAWIQDHPEVLTTEEYRDRQHHGAWSVISQARHWIKKVDKHGGIHKVTGIGAAWCRENLNTTSGNSPDNA